MSISSELKVFQSRFRWKGMQHSYRKTSPVIQSSTTLRQRHYQPRPDADFRGKIVLFISHLTSYTCFIAKLKIKPEIHRMHICIVESSSNIGYVSRKFIVSEKGVIHRKCEANI
jgi:hypothetical protein